MLFYLVVLLIVVPAVELVILLQVHHAIASAWGSWVGLLVTLGTIVLTGVAGAALARHQGLGVWRELRNRLAQRQLPGREILDGVLVLVGAALLLTPGFLTDLVGFSLLIPFTRCWYRGLVVRWFRRKLGRGEAHVTTIVTEGRRVDSEPPDGPE